jgi:hypothetical protein
MIVCAVYCFFSKDIVPTDHLEVGNVEYEPIYPLECELCVVCWECQAPQSCYTLLYNKKLTLNQLPMTTNEHTRKHSPRTSTFANK